MASGRDGHVGGTQIAVTVSDMSVCRSVRRDEQGGASVLAIAVIATVLMIGGAVMFAAAASAAQIAVQHAADEAALAGARAARAQVALGESVAATACAAARGAASEQGATVTRCVTAGAVVTVSVELSRGPTTANAQAVAGPASAAPG